MIHSKVDPLEVYITHLDHFSRSIIPYEFLLSRYNRKPNQARNDAESISSHVKQALEFYHLSKVASERIKPVLQYYCYLNFAVATIFAYRPINMEFYKKHGVQDLSAKIKKIDLGSYLVKTTPAGSVPLFNSVISQVDLRFKYFRFNHLIGSVPFLSYELSAAYKKKLYVVHVEEKIIEAPLNAFKSTVKFTTFNRINNQKTSTNKERIEEAMPILKTAYYLDNKRNGSFEYFSKATWNNLEKAKFSHRKNCLFLTNYGGHSILNDPFQQISMQYSWQYMFRKKLLPTITASLLLSFSFASICRYRPQLLVQLLNSRFSLIYRTFLNESPGYMIPFFRNLLYREEMIVRPEEFT